jgi:hypothetical protein
VVEGDTHFFLYKITFLFHVTFRILPFLFGDLLRKSSVICCVSTVFVAEDDMHLLQ